MRTLNGHVASAIGIDSILTKPIEFDRCYLIPGYFLQDCAYSGTFDVISVLATIQHIPTGKLTAVADACWKYLNHDGCVIRD